MATKKKLLQAAAGQAGGAGLDVEDVFSTYLYEGNGDGSAATNVQTINNGIDLSGEGGMVWIKGRSHTTDHIINDTVRGAGNTLQPHLTDANQTGYYDISQFNSDGFGLDAGGNVNANGYDYASWTFRKAPKFFTMVQWSGNSTMGRTISHDLGTDVGFILIKAVDKADAWYALHKDSNMLVLNQTTAEYNDATTADYFGDGTNIVRPTSTDFTIGSDAGINGTGYNYIAYLFAHNDGDGEFGPDGDQDIIKCGSYTSSNPTNRPEVDLGFEPQWLLIKNATASSNWMLVDNMRGLPVNGGDQTLAADSNAAENGIIGEPNAVALTPTGFKLTGGVTASNASTGNTHIYIAIRRGPLAQPESATEVFDVDTRSDATSNPPSYSANGIVDMALQKELNASGWGLWDRLRGQYRLQTHLTNAEDGPFSYANFDHMDGWGDIGATDTTHSWMWKRAPGFFDAVAFLGDGVAGRTVSHNLGVAPEMMWVKRRESTGVWGTYHSGVDATSPEDFYLKVESTGARVNDARFWNDTAPDDTVFTLGTHSQVNFSGGDYIAYLFASLPGISKVGSYTGNGTSQTIDCGFTSGARFVLGKRTDSASDWYLFDSVRGITTSYDPYLALNLSDAEATVDNIIRPDSSGFALGNAGHLNQSGGSFIFYAIA